MADLGDQHRTHYNPPTPIHTHSPGGICQVSDTVTGSVVPATQHPSPGDSIPAQLTKGRWAPLGCKPHQTQAVSTLTVLPGIDEKTKQIKTSQEGSKHSCEACGAAKVRS